MNSQYPRKSGKDKRYAVRIQSASRFPGFSSSSDDESALFPAVSSNTRKRKYGGRANMSRRRSDSNRKKRRTVNSTRSNNSIETNDILRIHQENVQKKLTYVYQDDKDLVNHVKEMTWEPGQISKVDKSPFNSKIVAITSRVRHTTSPVGISKTWYGAPSEHPPVGRVESPSARSSNKTASVVPLKWRKVSPLSRKKKVCFGLILFLAFRVSNFREHPQLTGQMMASQRHFVATNRRQWKRAEMIYEQNIFPENRLIKKHQKE